MNTRHGIRAALVAFALVVAGCDKEDNHSSKDAGIQPVATDASVVANPDAAVVDPPDAAVVTPDASVVEPRDAAVVTPDASIVEPRDAAVVTPDASVVEPRDAAVVTPDASVVEPHDAAVVTPDASVVEPRDAAVEIADAAIIEPPDAAVEIIDAAVEQPDASVSTEMRVTFTPDAPLGSGEVGLRFKGFDPERRVLELELVGDGLSSIYGLGANLGFDQTVVNYRDVVKGNALNDGAAPVLAAAAATETGCTLGVSRRGVMTAAKVTRDEVIATLSFTVTARGTTTMALGRRSAVLDANLRAVNVKWKGGTLVVE